MVQSARPLVLPRRQLLSQDGWQKLAGRRCLGRASSAITLRAGPRIRSPSTTPSEPSTIICGLSASISSASPRPIHLPATAATCNASGSSRSIESASVRMGVPELQRDGNISAANSTSPAPDANDSHEPLFPKPSGPSSASRQWPTSPAVSLAPRSNCPLTMNPAPTPVPNVRKTRCLRFGRLKAHAKMELGQCAGISVVLDYHRNARKCLHQPRLQWHSMPTRQMRRIEQDPSSILRGPPMETLIAPTFRPASRAASISPAACSTSFGNVAAMAPPHVLASRSVPGFSPEAIPPRRLS